jgi:hypothetical protein
MSTTGQLQSVEEREEVGPADPWRAPPLAGPAGQWPRRTGRVALVVEAGGCGPDGVGRWLGFRVVPDLPYLLRTAAGGGDHGRPLKRLLA